MQNGDKALLSIILAGRGLVEKMLITLEWHHFLIKFCIHIKHCRDTGMQFAENKSGRSWSDTYYS